MPLAFDARFTSLRVLDSFSYKSSLILILTNPLTNKLQNQCTNVKFFANLETQIN